jgi:heterodisulfide reductase subunit A
MVSVGRHENITLLSYSEIEKVSGYVGNFEVRVRKKARYVEEDPCNGCGTCVEKCPWKKIPSEFDKGMGNRSAIYFTFPQAVPRIPVIDVENCAYFLDGKCKACEKFCPTGAINFEQKDTLLELEVGTIILATGFKDFDPSIAPKYGYPESENVVTGIEFERMVNSGGPTSGEVLLKDGRKPESIAIVHCVGSRDEEYHEYCSRVCCMYSLKLAHLVRDSIDAEVYEFYRDMRTYGKGYEDFYERVQEEGVHFIRFDKDIEVTKQNGRLTVSATGVFNGELNKIPVDMVVLSTGLEPQDDQLDMARIFNLSLSPDGFFLEKHPKLGPVETITDGIFLAGTCQGPKDIPDSVAHSGAAAAAALSLMDAGHVALEAYTAFIVEERCSGCRTCESLCPYNAIEMVDRDGRIVAHINAVICKGCGVCSAGCPSGAAVQHGFKHEQIMAELDGIFTSFMKVGISEEELQEEVLV